MLTFKDICKFFMERVKQMAASIITDSCEIHVVFDFYEKESIKSQARAVRSGNIGHVHHIKITANIPKNWKLFLSHQENKAGLAKCIALFVKAEGSSYLQGEQKLCWWWRRIFNICGGC